MLVVLLAEEPRKFRQRDAFAVVVALGALVALDGLWLLAELLVAPRHRAPHAGVVRSERGGLAVVEKRVVRHGQDLVRLAEAVPRAVVLGVDVDGVAVGIDRRRRVLELDVFVAHECPGGEEVLVELEGTPEVGHRLLVLALERVVVTDNAARLGTVLVHLHAGVREARELPFRLLDVEDVGEGVHVLETVGLEHAQLLEALLRGVELAQVVLCQRQLALDVTRAWEEAQQLAVGLDGLRVLLCL
mmetsp:Transcript_11012/g.25925  ORF Transcript_11012/g.25925 Transcript_11012/m.25925 type:complete len:245 (-) Transcript_11012:721-1455(-)